MANKNNRIAPQLSKAAQLILDTESDLSQSLPGLTPKQANFVIEYLVDMNATQAAIRAGYSDKPTVAKAIGSENLSKPYIREAINKQMSARARRTLVNADYVIGGLTEVFERCLQREPVREFVDGEWIETGEYRFEQNGANKALETLGKHLGILTDKVEHNAGEGVEFNMSFTGKHED